MKLPLFEISVLIMAIVSVSCNKSGPVSNLRCEYQVNPINIDNENPRFSWNYDVPDDLFQNSYLLEIAEDSNFNEVVWSSGEVVTSSTLARYEGAELKSNTKYYWRLIYELSNGKTFSSGIQTFETAMMPSYVWKGKWISDGNDKSHAPAPMLRKSFVLDKPVADAKLYISAAAYYKLFVNGSSSDNIMLDPGYTHYDKRNLYSVYDIDTLFHNGENVVATVLGSGFYNEDKPVATWNFEDASWRDRPKMLAEIHISFTDGTKMVIPSDESWKASIGPYLSDNIYSGDVYDARKELPGWNDIGFDDTSWQNAELVSAPSDRLVAQQCPPIRVSEVLKPVDMKSFGDSVYVFDFGKNISGLCSIVLNGQRGTKVTMTHGELLRKDARVEMGNIDIYYNRMDGYEMQTDTYYMKGENKDETFSPMFSYHGFRYVQVETSAPMKIEADDITARFFHTDLVQTGKFACSNELLNRIWDATNLSYLGNLMSIPTDCPQREKNGWTADAYLALDFALLNYDAIKFYEKWIDDLIDNQREDGNVSGIVPTAGWGYDDWIGPVWAAAWFIIPYSLYIYTGDDSSIEKIFPACKKYLQYLKNREDNDGAVTYGIGDWLCYNTTTPTEYTTTCYYYYENMLAARFADILGEDSSIFIDKAAELKALINRKYFDTGKYLYSNGSQTAQGVALYMDIVPEEYKYKVASNLNDMIVENDCFLDFGTIGSKTVLRQLSDYGFFDTAFKMASKKEIPSWGAWIESGLTTLAETWKLDMTNFRDASANHVFLGDVSAWMTSYIAGIRPGLDDNGELCVSIEPHFPDGLDWASAEYTSLKGTFNVDWKRDGANVILKVKTPANTKTKIFDESCIVGGGQREFVIKLK